MALHTLTSIIQVFSICSVQNLLFLLTTTYVMQTFHVYIYSLLLLNIKMSILHSRSCPTSHKLAPFIPSLSLISCIILSINTVISGIIHLYHLHMESLSTLYAFSRSIYATLKLLFFIYSSLIWLKVFFSLFYQHLTIHLFYLHSLLPPFSLLIETIIPFGKGLQYIRTRTWQK